MLHCINWYSDTGKILHCPVTETRAVTYWLLDEIAKWALLNNCSLEGRSIYNRIRYTLNIKMTVNNFIVGRAFIRVDNANAMNVDPLRYYDTK